MPVLGSASCPQLPKAGGVNSGDSVPEDALSTASVSATVTPTGSTASYPGGLLSGVGTNGRGRSGSPSTGRGLAGDLRRHALAVRDSPGNASDHSISLGNAMTPPHAGLKSSSSLVEPAGRVSGRHDPSQTQAVHMAVKQQVAPIMRQLDNVVNSIQAEQRKADKLDRKVNSLVDDVKALASSASGKDASGGAAAELKGSVSGLMEGLKDIRERVDGLDQRLFQRTSGLEAVKQRGQELHDKMQALEQHTRQTESSREEVQRRQVKTVKRVEQGVEELSQRIRQIEEELRMSHGGRHRDLHSLEARLVKIEQSQDHHQGIVGSLQTQVDETFREAQEQKNLAHRSSGSGKNLQLDGAASRLFEQGLDSIERRIATQVQDLATSLANVRVKVDGQAQRSTQLAGRLETAHEPAIEAMRQELTKARQQDWSRVEAELAQLRSNMHATAEEVAADEAHATAGEREHLRQANSEMAAQMRMLDERLKNEVADLRSHFQAICEQHTLQPPPEAAPRNAGMLVAGRDEDLERRLEVLERSTLAGGMQVGQTSSHIDHAVGVLEQMDAVSQRASDGEAVIEILKNKVHQLQGEIDHLARDDGALWDHMQDFEAKLRVISEVGRGGGLAPGVSRHSLEASSIAMEGSPGGGSGYHRRPRPLTAPSRRPPGDPEDSDSDRSLTDQDPAWGAELVVEEARLITMLSAKLDDNEADHEAGRALQQEMDAVTERLQATDSLASRVADLEEKLQAIVGPVAINSTPSSSTSPRRGAPHGGSDFVIRQIRCLSREVSELQARLLASQLGLQTGGAVSQLQHEGAAGDEDTPREEEIIALSERINDLEQELIDLATNRQPNAGPIEQSQTQGGATASTGADGAALARDTDGTASHDGRPAQRPLTPTPRQHANALVDAHVSENGDGSDINLGDLQRDHEIAIGMQQELALATSEANDLAQLSQVHHGAFAGHLDHLEDVLRGFAVRIGSLKIASDASHAETEGVAHRTSEMWGHMDDLKGGMVDQRRELEDTRNAMDQLSEQVAEMDANVAYVRRRGEQTTADLKAVMQRLRGLQERDLVALIHDSRLSRETIDGVSELVENLDHRLGIVEHATLTLKQDLQMTHGTVDEAVSESGHGRSFGVAASQR